MTGTQTSAASQWSATRKMNTDAASIHRLIAARHPCVVIPTTEERYATQCVQAAVGDMLRPIWTWSATRGVRTSPDDDARPVEKTEHPAAGMYALARSITGPAVAIVYDIADHLEDAGTLRALRELIHQCGDVGATTILIDHSDQLPDVIESQATRYELSLPEEDEIVQIIKDTLRREHKQRGIKVEMNKNDLQTVVRNLSGLNRSQVRQITVETVAEDQKFDAEDINHILAHKRRHLHSDGLLEYIEAPVSLDEIGGLHNLKRWLKHRENAMNEQAAAFGLTMPRGVLLLGVQGAGKSLSAKAIATAWQRPILRLDPGALYNRWIGESERRLRRALRQAERMAPIVLWIDEIEKGFASAASHSNDGGLSQRMFGALLTWMQEHEKPVFLVATANNIEALPPELLRKGRFDEIFFVDLPDHETRRIIARIHIEKRDRDPESFDLEAIAEAAEGYSGAEIEQGIIAALHEAYAAGEDLTTARIIAALRQSPPLSVTMSERIARLRQWAEGRCVPAG